jgi:hypothetical protein
MQRRYSSGSSPCRRADATREKSAEVLLAWSSLPQNSQARLPVATGLMARSAPFVAQDQPPVVEEARQHFLLVVRVLEGSANVAALVLELRTLLLHPREEAVHVRTQVLRAQALDLRRGLTLPRRVELEDPADPHQSFTPDLALGDRCLPISSSTVVPTSDGHTFTAIVLEIAGLTLEFGRVCEPTVPASVSPELALHG